MSKIKNHTFLIIAIAAVLSLALRVFFLLKPGYSFDINCFLDWGGRIKDGGFWSLFSGDYYVKNGIDYPPLVPLISSWWFAISHTNNILFFKILPTVFELGLIAINVWFVLKANFKYKNLLLLVVILQPALGFVSSAWGQVDSIMSLLVVSGFLFFEKNLFLSSFLLFLAFLCKPQAAIAIFIYFVCLFFRFGKKEFAKHVVFYLVMFGAMIIAFKAFGDSNFLDPYTKSVGRYTNVSLNAFNLWWLMFHQKAWDLQDTVGPYKKLGLILFAIFEIPVMLYAIKRKIHFPDLMLLTAYSYLVFFIFPTQIHERYLFPAIALLAIPAISSSTVFYLYIALTVTFLYNCFAVMQSVYPQFSFISGNLLLGDIPVIVAFVNVFSVLIFAYYLINESFGKTKNKQ